MVMTSLKGFQIKLRFPLFVLVAAAVLSASAADYYVDGVKGDDAKDGRTPETAFRTFKCATRRLRAGDTLNLVAGQVYGETLYIWTSGTPEKPIVIRGNGAVIDGLKPIPDESWQAKGEGLFFSPNKRCWGAHDPQVVNANGSVISLDPSTGRRYAVAKLAPGQAGWDKEGTWYRSADGKPPKGLRGYFLGEGVNIHGDASYITVENLTCEHVSNDGFNVHGSSLGLVFRNIVGRNCGDEGLSVHEDVQAVVYNGLFYGNGDGICDICASQTQYFGCTVVSNRLFGIGFHGGSHALYGCTVKDNGGEQLYAEPSHLEDYRFDKASPALQGLVYLKNTVLSDGAGSALVVKRGASVHADRCELTKTRTGALVRTGGTLHVTRSKWGSFAGERVVVEPGGILKEDCGVEPADALGEMLEFARAAEKELRHTPTCGEKQSTFGSGDSTPRAVRTAICTMSVFDTLGKSDVPDAAHWEKLAAEVDKTLFFAASVTAGKSPEIDFKCFDGRHWDKLGVWGFTEDFPRLEDADPFMRSNPRPLTVRTDPDWFPAPPQAELPVAGYYDRCAVRAERAYRASCAYRGVKYAAPGRDVRAGGFVGLNKTELLSEGWYENGEYKLDADIREAAPRGEGEGPNTVLRRQLRVRKVGPRTALVRERVFVLKDCELPRGLLAVPFTEGSYLLLDGENRRVDGDLFARAGETLYDVTYAVDADGDAARLASCRGLRMEPAYLTEPGDETETWQAKIDAASAAGGGTVTVPAGAHKVAQLELKDNVTLELAEGATLFAVTNGTAYRWTPWVKAELQEAGVVVAYGATNIGIVGKGTIDGCGDRRPFFRTDEIRWRNVYMRGCRGVRIEGIRLDHPSFWTIFLRACDRVHLKGVTSHASANINNDGMDLSVSNALIEDCDIDSEDDALVLKGFDPDFVSENVEIRNCRIATTGNCIKFGTETFSRCRNYEIHHCSIGAADRFGPRAPNFTRYPMTVTNEYRCESGLAFLTVDGGTIEDVRVHDIEIRGGVLIPFAFRLGHRYGEENWGRSVIRGVTLERVTMTKPAFSAVGCFISGIAERDIEDVTIRDCHFKMRAFPDGILRLHAKFPENARRYPSPGMFDGALPGYFLFTTHAKNVQIENVKVDLTGEGEKRPAVVADEKGTVSVRNCAFDVFER